jgi:hypothetical protein
MAAVAEWTGGLLLPEEGVWGEEVVRGCGAIGYRGA